jgi:hypothetical protein
MKLIIFNYVHYECLFLLPAFYSFGNGEPSPRVKRLGRKADVSLPSSDEVKEKKWSYTPTIPHAFKKSTEANIL